MPVLRKAYILELDEHEAGVLSVILAHVGGTPGVGRPRQVADDIQAALKLIGVKHPADVLGQGGTYLESITMPSPAPGKRKRNTGLPSRIDTGVPLG